MAIHYDRKTKRFRSSTGSFVSASRAKKSATARAEYLSAQRSKKRTRKSRKDRKRRIRPGLPEGAIVSEVHELREESRVKISRRKARSAKKYIADFYLSVDADDFDFPVDWSQPDDSGEEF